MESRSIHRDGARLHGLWRPGRGHPIMVVPGVMADAASYVPVIEAIDRPEPVLIVDRRGRAPSGPLGKDYSIETEVQDARSWIEQLGEAVTLAGWSYGATIALETAARDCRVAGVVGYEPVLGPFGAEALPALREADLDRRVEIINRDVSGFSPEHVAALRQTPAWPALCRLAEPLAAELTALNDFDPTGDWSAITAELLLGERNQHTEPYGPAFERLTARLPHATVSILPGQGHLAHVDDPAALGRMFGPLIARIR
ncbi:MAG: alpha/beta hydrolase [Propionibacteriales bacterium]|nr:alpha/beta hydrolase [Propionibacteriales bacterium]